MGSPLFAGKGGAVMKSWIRKTLLGCVVASAPGVPSAYADGGTITFSGAIVVPTSAPDSAAMSSGHAGVSLTSAPSYTLSVEPLEASTLSSDRLIVYFAGYVRASGKEGSPMQLVTQAYE